MRKLIVTCVIILLGISVVLGETIPSDRSDRSMERIANQPKAKVQDDSQSLDAYTLSITRNSNTTNLINRLLKAGSGLTIKSVTFTGSDSAAGLYQGAPFGITDGIILATGDVLNALPPNDGVSVGNSFNRDGCPECDSIIPGYTSYDAAILSIVFDACDSCQSLSFDFIFGSEEYPEFLGDDFNDVFGAYLNGTQIAFDAQSAPITINGPFFSGGYVQTPPGNGMEYDGSTLKLKTLAPITPGSVNNTLKFVICDAGDHILDSGVLLASLSGGVKEVTDTTTGTPPYFTLPAGMDCGDTVNVSIGQTASFQVQADHDSGSVVLSVQNLPSGATMTPSLPLTGHPATSTFSWTPATGQNGVYAVTFIATNTFNGLFDECVIYIAAGSSAQGAMLYFFPDPAYLLPPGMGAATPVQLCIQGAEHVMGVSAEIHYDHTKVNINNYAVDGFLASNGAIVTDLSSYNNSTGILTVQLTAAGGTPKGVSGDGTIMYLNFVAVSSNSASDLTFASADLRDTLNVSLPVTTDNGRFEAIAAGDLLCDFDNDWDVDFADYTLFVSYWNQVPDNLLGDVASSITGVHPGAPPWSKSSYPYPGEGVINFEDQMVFTLMYNWSYQKGLSPKHPGDDLSFSAPFAFGPELEIPATVACNEAFTVMLTLADATDLIGWHFAINYDSDALVYHGNNLEQILAAENNHISNLDQISRNRIEINRTIMGDSPLEGGQPVTVEFYFEAVGEGASYISIEDVDLRTGSNRCLKIDPQSYQGERGITIIGHSLTTPLQFELSQNYPNPFNPVTTIRYSLTTPSPVTVRVYNIAGQLVRTLVEEMMPAGKHSVDWDATDESGAAVSSGIYFYKIETDGYVESKKMILLK